MDIKSNKEGSNEKSVNSKLRRLKIQEKIISQQLKKSDRSVSMDSMEDNLSIDPEITNSDCRNLQMNLYDKFNYIKNLFDEVQVHTNSKELLVDLDIKEMKSKVFELENNIKIFKSYLGSELNKLKIDEKNLTEQLQEGRETSLDITKKHAKVLSAKYNDIVPSPVRSLMTTPFKCVEVQEFQDFLKNSPNRYGGWNEYNHNIFVRFWQKYFGMQYSPDFEDGNIQSLDKYDVFVQEMSELHGVNKGDVLKHIQWYVKYIYLKGQQQKAIDKWKLSKQTFLNKEKQIRKRKVNNEALGQTQCNIKTDPENYRKPTKQSQYRSFLDDDASYINAHFSVLETQKLGIPNWRIGLTNSSD